MTTRVVCLPDITHIQDLDVLMSDSTVQRVWTPSRSCRQVSPTGFCLFDDESRWRDPARRPGETGPGLRLVDGGKVESWKKKESRTPNVYGKNKTKQTDKTKKTILRQGGLTTTPLNSLKQRKDMVSEFSSFSLTYLNIPSLVTKLSGS